MLGHTVGDAHLLQRPSDGLRDDDKPAGHDRDASGPDSGAGVSQPPAHAMPTCPDQAAPTAPISRHRSGWHPDAPSAEFRIELFRSLCLASPSRVVSKQPDSRPMRGGLAAVWLTGRPHLPSGERRRVWRCRSVGWLRSHRLMDLQCSVNPPKPSRVNFAVSTPDAT